MSPDACRIVIVDDHPVVLAGLRQLLEADGGFEVVAACSDPREALSIIRRQHPSVVLLDLRMPALSGLDLARSARESVPEARIILLTADLSQDEVSAEDHLAVDAILLKDVVPSELIQAIRAAAGLPSHGTPPRKALVSRSTSWRRSFGFTRREMAVALLLVEGMTNAEIAQRLNITVNTVKTHVTNLHAKAGVTSTRRLLAVLSAGRAD